MATNLIKPEAAHIALLKNGRWSWTVYFPLQRGWCSGFGHTKTLEEAAACVRARLDLAAGLIPEDAAAPDLNAARCGVTEGE